MKPTRQCASTHSSPLLTRLLLVDLGMPEGVMALNQGICTEKLMTDRPGVIGHSGTTHVGDDMTRVSVPVGVLKVNTVLNVQDIFLGVEDRYNGLTLTVFLDPELELEL
ncbi:hypothetical protein B0H14DRAFT_2580447 [Mycena olivaceomarginata]|nr:hypothetical protein B0H14DRAFT_2580447 [Mycena olivaceomarginata]